MSRLLSHNGSVKEAGEFGQKWKKFRNNHITCQGRKGRLIQKYFVKWGRVCLLLVVSLWIHFGFKLRRALSLTYNASLLVILKKAYLPPPALGCNRTTTMCGQQLLLWLLSAHRTVSSKMTAPAQLSAHLNVLFKWELTSKKSRKIFSNFFLIFGG